MRDGWNVRLQILELRSPLGARLSGWKKLWHMALQAGCWWEKTYAQTVLNLRTAWASNVGTPYEPKLTLLLKSHPLGAARLRSGSKVL